MYPEINTNNTYEVHPTVEYFIKTCPEGVRNYLLVKTGQMPFDEAELQYALQEYIMRGGEPALDDLYEKLHPDFDQIKKRVLSTVVSNQPSVVSLTPNTQHPTPNTPPHVCANNDIICQLKDFFTIKINVITAVALVIIGYIIFKALQDSKSN